MLDADPSLVRASYKGAATTILEAIAQPDVFGKHLEVKLGVKRRMVSLLIKRGSELDGPLNLAACFNRAELVAMLLEAAHARWPAQSGESHHCRRRCITARARRATSLRPELLRRTRCTRQLGAAASTDWKYGSTHVGS